ncbi:MAG: nucleotidyltransferase family protein [Bacteroidota bacterium]
MSESPPLIVTIILAAGESRRMGKPKLFLPVYGSTMLRLAAWAAVDLNTKSIVVTGAYPQETRNHLADIDDLEFAHNADWRKGMSSSIATGVKAALQYNPQGYFITLADQPSLRSDSLAGHAEEFYRDSSEIVATYYPERLGVPAIFPARYAEQLLDGKGPNGARQLIAAAGDKVKVVKFGTPPIDIDTPEEYQRYLMKYQRAKNAKGPIDQ